ncbi:MAG: hypothetical protein ACREPD_05410 [Stenotrophomonas sp.]|uniref:hypothetical protein n=1 Tax=Stenotrophomonas sp. TaxID=69392 RepID=UPI003D6D52C0
MNAKITDACQRCGRCRDGDFANCKNARSLAASPEFHLRDVADMLDEQKQAETLRRAADRIPEQQPHMQPSAVGDSRAQWPFVESPGEFADRLRIALREFDLLGAVRNVLIENPPALAATGTQQVGEVQGAKLSQMDPWSIAEMVRTDLDRQSCPDAYMRIAMESVVKHLTTIQPMGEKWHSPLARVADAYGVTGTWEQIAEAVIAARQPEVK